MICVLCPTYRTGREPATSTPDLACPRCASTLAAHLAAIARYWPALPDKLPRGSAPGGPRVSCGGDEAAEPLRVTVLDLLLPARYGSVVGVRGEQLGEVSVATELDFWVRDWAGARGEGLPVPTVPVLVAWLADRLTWAVHAHLALDEFGGAMRGLAGRMRVAVGDTEARPEPLDGIPCRRCDVVGSLYRVLGKDDESDRIECGRCMCLMTENEYKRWTKMCAAYHQQRQREEQMKATEILTVLNGLEEVDLDRCEFVVVTKASEYQQGGFGGLVHTPGVEHDWPFARGEILVLDKETGREPFGEQRKPGKWDVDIETAKDLADALAIRARVLPQPEDSAA